MSRGEKGENLFLCLSLTLGARDFSSAVSGFCQVFIVKSDPREKFLKIPAARETNLWYPGYLSLRASSTLGGVARSHSIATRERRRDCEGWRPPPPSASPLARSLARSLAARFARHSKCRTCSLATSVPPHDPSYFFRLLGGVDFRAPISLACPLLKGNQ